MISFLYVLLGLLLIGVSVPLIRRRVRPNPWYGFRTPKTLGNEAIWYDANEFSGRMLLRAGYITVIGALVIALLPLSWANKAMADVTVMLVSVWWAAGVSFAYLRNL